MSSDLFGGISEQEKAGKHRLDDARALLAAGRWRGSMYLAGYAVECVLKVKLMRTYQCRNLNELELKLKERGLIKDRETLFDHRLERLLNLTRATDRLRVDPTGWRHFARANRWITSWRYDPSPGSVEEANGFLTAVEHTLRWIELNV